MNELMSLPEQSGEKPRETVRVILVDDADNVLLLQKSEHSVARHLHEFPGGNIDEISGTAPTLLEQKQAAIREAVEETGFSLSRRALRKAETFTYPYNGISRRVHVFVAHVPGVEPPFVFGQMKDKEGHPLDLHAGGKWVSLPELDRLKDENKLIGNSLHYKKAFRIGKQADRIPVPA
jgi:8-oxo-dGTP pyrophosphatase MutT (NUDIX family)